MKNGFYDNLTSSFTIHEMDDCQCVILKEINVLVSLIICPIANNLINTSTYYRVSNRRGGRNKGGGWKISAKIINGEDGKNLQS